MGKSCDYVRSKTDEGDLDNERSREERDKVIKKLLIMEEATWNEVRRWAKGRKK